MNPIFISKLQSFLTFVPSLFVNINAKELETRPAPDKWSKKEIMGHLIDSARVNLQRFLEAQHTPSVYVVQRYQQDELVKINDYQNLPVEEIAQLWKSLNQQICRIFEKIPSEQLSKKVEIPHEGKSETLQYIMEDYVDHMEHHFRQIFGSLDFEKKNEKRQVSVVEAMKDLGGDTRFATVLEHGTMLVEIYQPIGQDPQSPHAQDELYIIISGSGDFYNDGITQPFQTGDVLFVPAGVEHRFENFTEDFKTWVIFYGAMGGER